MNRISVLSQDTIDKIAAGEVVERPASIVKELVENAVDAGANAITVEIKDGGISLIRITDNGSGIPKDEVQAAFLRHATSKIRSVEDLETAGTLGFRGEALSSIAAVCQVEMITKTAGSITGVRYTIEGGVEQGLEEIGAPEGTTFLVRNVFYHTPARKKFLKSAATEAGYVSDLMERMALSHPHISFKFINNNAARLHTSGNCSLKDIIYGIYGRDIASNLVKAESPDKDGIAVSGFIGRPAVSRGNRNYENYFVNGRYVKSAIIAKAIEDAYQPFMMSRRYPFTALSLQIDPHQVDVNVHPTKMEVRFSDQPAVYDRVYQTVKDALSGRELIPEFTLPEKHGAVGRKEAADTHTAVEPKENAEARTAVPPREDTETRTVIQRKEAAETRRPDTGQRKVRYPEPFEKIRSQLIAEADSPYEVKYPHRTGALSPVTGYLGSAAAGLPEGKKQEEPIQMDLFENRLLDEKNIKKHKLIGQLFDTYWLVEFDGKLFIIDQHAAHEKVLYERFMEQLQEKKQTSQMITPPVIVTLNLQEEEILKRYHTLFTETGFEIEHFGGRDYSISAVPGNLYSIPAKTLFTEILDGLTDVSEKASLQAVQEKIASMSCKAAVKGNSQMSAQEADALIAELLTLENPYNCPHGRPTIISMTKYELEKKFKRIV